MWLQFGLVILLAKENCYKSWRKMLVKLTIDGGRGKGDCLPRDKRSSPPTLRQSANFTTGLTNWRCGWFADVNVQIRRYGHVLSKKLACFARKKFYYYSMKHFSFLDFTCLEMLSNMAAGWGWVSFILQLWRDVGRPSLTQQQCLKNVHSGDVIISFGPLAFTQ